MKINKIVIFINSFAWGFSQGPPSSTDRIVSFLLLGLWNGLWFYLIYRVKPIGTMERIG
jgi:hypothetical protein